MKRHSVRIGIWTGAIVGGRPRAFLIRPCSASTGRTRCRCLGSGRPWTADSGSWKRSTRSWPTAWAASWRPSAASRTSAVAAWNGSWDRCWPCASAPCCTPRSASAAGAPSGTPASRSPSAICRPSSAPRRLSSAPDLCLQQREKYAV